ncbi:MAG: threonine-phosphate decarboxylase [Deltaproteobacteria bacterium]|nr:threonine-phosphate decarboxylase [Deltaproteobacteria bacterium]
MIKKKKYGYQHGGNPMLDLERLKIKKSRLLDFSVNLNSFGVPPIIREKWQELFDSIEDYPTVEGDGIIYYYREKIGVPPDNFLAGNGSTELIYLAPRALKLKSVLIITPSYHDYERASISAGASVAMLPLSAADSFSFPSLNRLASALKNADALWLGRPNNPTGTLVEKDVVMELASRFSDKWFIIDEAFIQFIEGWEKKSLITEKRIPNILVIHSLTKFYAIAGLRMGGIIGDSDAISRMTDIKEPWTINGIADKVAPLLVHCDDYELRSRLTLKIERDRVYRKLESIDGITPFSSTANFILCRWTCTDNLDDLLRYLLSNGVYVRDCRNYPGLKGNYFRICIRKHEENNELVSIIKNCSLRTSQESQD